MPSDGPLDRLFRNIAVQNAQNNTTNDTNITPPPPDSNRDHQNDNGVTGQTEADAGGAAGQTTAVQPTTQRTRDRYHVNSLSERYRVTRWMVQESENNGPKRIMSKAVKAFPRLFTKNNHANLEKARRWWKSRDKTLSLKKDKVRLGNLVFTSADGRRINGIKVMSGRGRKRAPWVAALQVELLQEFERLASAGVKFSPAVLQRLARDLIHDAPVGSPFHSSTLYKDVPIHDKITVRWIQHFMTRNSIVVREQTGKLCTSPEKKLLIEKEVAYHMGVLKRGFDSGELQEEAMENADETHFVFNMDNGKTLGLRGTNYVKYADVVSGGEKIMMMVRLTGGANATVEVPFLIFKNANRSYPIRGVPDRTPGVCYRSQPKRWMDAGIFLEWLSESRAMSRKQGTARVLYVDNCGGHVVDGAVEQKLTSLNTKLYKFPANATDLIQPADSSVIQKLKDIWRKYWEEYKSDCVRRGSWTAGSGCLPNSGKPFFLNLSARVVREFNLLRDKNGINYTRKAMIRTGMSKDIDGTWRESQLSAELQEIIAKHRTHFEGELVHGVSPADIETETDDD